VLTPSHAPSEAVKPWPSCVWLGSVIVETPVFNGATARVATLVDDAVPAPTNAVTVTLIVSPTSVGFSVYVLELLAPPTATQTGEQLSHV
jgi:hypothetical protein